MLLAVFTICAILSSINGAEPGNVAFSASLEHETSIAINTVIRYNNVPTNVGRAYDSSTGTFTAPRSGLYVFHVHGLTAPGKGFWICIYHNDVCIYKAHGSSAANWEMGGNSVVLFLKPKDRVFVKGTHPSTMYGDGNNIYGSFTGYLI